MRALVVYESMFGNTKAVAEQVKVGLETAMAVDVVAVEQAPELDTIDVDLVVVGAPTHAFGLSREGTRQDAAQRAGGATATDRALGVREWLFAAHSVPAGLVAATFDTHVKTPPMPGRASRATEKRLQRLGAGVVAAESFYVHGYEGPMLDGELERARAWGESLATTAPERVSA